MADVPTDTFIPFRLTLENGDTGSLFPVAGPVAAGVQREDLYSCSGSDEFEYEYIAHTVLDDGPIWTIHVIDDDGSSETMVKIVEALR